MNFHDYQAGDFVCDESFQRYCIDGNEADTLLWESWIARHPEKQAAVLEAKHMIALLSAKQGNRLEQLRHLKDGIQQYDLLKEALAGESVQQEAPPRRRVLKYAAVLAAIVALLTITYLYIPHSSQRPENPQKTDHTLISSGNDPRKTVVLPDGSVIILRKNSTIELAAGFNRDNRQLTLTGEAFFDVTHDVKRPFMVHTAVADIKVLGTVFNVSVYNSNRQMETALFKGSVEVAWKAGPGKKIILNPNQKLVIGHTTEQEQTAATDQPFKIVPLDADPVNHKAKEIAWVRNQLEIENEPLEVIAAKLEKWYGIPVVFADDEVKKYRYSGTFESETVIKALDALQLSYPFSFKMVNGVIIISK